MVRSTAQKRSDHRGFTLIEILVALAILTIALSALVGGLNRNIDTTVELKTRHLAQWAAQDQIAQLRLKREWPTTGTQFGSDTWNGQRWRWKKDVSATADAHIRQVAISIQSPDNPVVLARLVDFIRRP